MKNLLAVIAGIGMMGYLSVGYVQPAAAKDKAKDKAEDVKAAVVKEEVKSAASSGRVEKDKKVNLQYTLTVDGAVVDASTPEKPFQYTHGTNMIIKGLEAALEGMKVGDSKKVTVEPKDAYGETNQQAFFKFPKAKIPVGTELKKGQIVTLMNQEKKPLKATVWEVGTDDVTLNANHPLAGKTLNFDVKVIAVE